MKRLIASGVGVVALGAFLAYQPVAGSAGGLAPVPSAPKPTPTAAAGVTTTPASAQPDSAQPTPAAETSAPAEKKSHTQTIDASLRSQPKQPQSISGSGGENSDDNEGENHRGKRHHDDRGDDGNGDDNGEFQGHDD